MVLPVVVMILGISLGALSLQLERLKLVSVAATLSRALARGEPQEKLEFLIQGKRIEVSDLENFLCVELSADFSLPGLAGLPFPISDRECARKLGL
jgi:hypothetical protein